MYILKLNELERGDIILTRSSNRESEIIRTRTGCDYSHAILYVGLSSCIESDGLGVQSQNLQRVLFEKESDAIVLRLKESVDDDVFQKIILFARRIVGTEYSTS